MKKFINIGDSYDEAVIAALKDVLKEHDAKFIEKIPLLESDRYNFEIGAERLTVDSDSYFIFLEGPDELVDRIAAKVAARVSRQGEL